MLPVSKPYYTHSFGAMGETLETARPTPIFQWFQFEETERHAQEPGEVVRFRPNGPKFRDLCYLDALITARGELVRMELVVRRAFIDGSNGVFAQDLVKSFVGSALPDACQSVLREFLQELRALGGSGVTPGYLVYEGQESEWKTETGWTRLLLANVTLPEGPSFVVQVSANPTAPNARRIEEKEFS